MRITDTADGGVWSRQVSLRRATELGYRLSPESAERESTQHVRLLGLKRRGMAEAEVSSPQANAARLKSSGRPWDLGRQWKQGHEAFGERAVPFNR